jgi:hypothetical protein
MFERTVHEAAEETGGRFARNTQVSIAGTSAIPHADKLAAPTWSHDVVPPEPPTGYEIDSLPDMTTLDGLPPAAPEQPTDDDTFTPMEPNE